MNENLPSDPLVVLQQNFGFKSFRPGQLEAIEALLSRKRVLCIQPTGHGKSLLYQLPSLLMGGMTLVISPLLALVRDQLLQLQERFGIPAASVNSDQSEAANANARQAAARGQLRILFIAPEQLDNLANYQFLLDLPVDFLVVDEAHCISTWGHDFRPSYRQIVNIARALEQKRPDLRVLGLTATASERTEEDIARQLQTLDGNPLQVLRSSMDRPNIALTVSSVQGAAEKLALLGSMLAQLEGCGILYCASREQTELVAGFLQHQGLDVIAYHAGYDAEQKRALQQAFTQGTHKVIAATNALGMGIDKPDIRFIIHVDMPGSITAYYQEVGRAGRDGQPAQGFLLFDPKDRRIQDHFIRSAQPTVQDFEKVLNHLTPDETGSLPTLTGIKVKSGLHPTRVTVIMAELLEQGLAQKELVAGKQVYRRNGPDRKPDLQRYEVQNQVRIEELEAMLRYGRSESGCLMQTLRIALGDIQAQPCGHCSQCRPDQGASAADAGQIAAARSWLDNRDTLIAATLRPAMAEGLAVLNGELRSPLFIAFMRNRGIGTQAEPAEALSQALQDRLLEKLTHLQGRYRFSAVVALPSRTWMQRDFTARLIGEALDVPVALDLLVWRSLPAQRQGELLNNDQRKRNVNGNMTLTRRPSGLGAGALLLLDDYIGSGATLKEAVSTLRKQGSLDNELVPLTMARVRWRLGARGMI